MTETWRTTLRARVSSGVLAGLFVLLTFSSIDGPDWRHVGAVLASSGLWVAVTWLLAFRPRLGLLANDEVLVVNPLRRRRFPLRDVDTVDTGYDGLMIRRRGGQAPVQVWAVQESNFKAWLKRPSRAKQVAAELMRRAQDARGES